VARLADRGQGAADPGLNGVAAAVIGYGEIPRSAVVFAMVLKAPRTPLVAEVCDDPQPGPGELRLKVRACGVCRTDLHVADGELPPARSSIVPGHEIVGVVDAVGTGVSGVSLGERRGAPWLGGTCGVCRYCRDGEENLCESPEFTGWTRDGGYAD
jgi:propanol-preferring alcohol dehydrogenase